MAKHFVKDLGEADSEEHAWDICIKLSNAMSPAAKKEFNRKKYLFKAHKIKSRWHACLFKED